jgi:hypothetical protein
MVSSLLVHTLFRIKLWFGETPVVCEIDCFDFAPSSTSKSGLNNIAQRTFTSFKMHLTISCCPIRSAKTRVT